MLEFVIEKLISLMGPISTLSRDKRELKDKALMAISAALTETKLYYRNLQKDGVRNLDAEAELVKFWGEAAIPLRHIDQELAMLCEHKSEYWLNPEEWSNEQVEAFGIKLTDVTIAYRQLAMPRFYAQKRRNAKKA